METTEFQGMLTRSTRFFGRNIQWLTRTAILFIMGIVIAHAFFPGFIDMLTAWLGFAEPSLATLLALSLLIFVVERVVRIEQALTDNDEPRQLRVFPANEAAYEHVSDLVGRMKPSHVDLLQFSGWHTVALLRKLGQIRPRPNVRLLLMDPEVADRFDADLGQFHRQRIVATEASARRLEMDEGMSIDVRYYHSTPAVSAVLVDDALVNLSWYSCHEEGTTAVYRVHGHSCAAIMGGGHEAGPLVTFARRHFDEVWSTATRRPAEPGPGELPSGVPAVHA
jgi:hypothetical protein